MGSKEGIQKACKDGAKVGVACEYTGWQPIHGAVSSGSIEVLELLVEMKADINAATKRQMQPMHIAAKEGDVPLLQRLTALNADVEAKTSVKKRPIHYACEAGHSGVVEYLLDAGCDPLTPDRNNCSPYDYAVLAMDQGVPESDRICDLLARKNCAKTGGGLQRVNPKAVPFTGIVTQVGEDVNKPGKWWWDPEKQSATEEARPKGHVHPNLPMQP
jgi:ankyrin repeat protein